MYLYNILYIYILSNRPIPESIDTLKLHNDEVMK